MSTTSEQFLEALAIIPRLPSPLLRAFIERGIERLDELDGDSDLEAIDEREGGSWSHPDDHPAELHIGRRL